MSFIRRFFGAIDAAQDEDSGALLTQLEGSRLVDGWPKRVTVGNTALLSASVTFPAGTFRLTLVPHGTTVIYMEKTTATANSGIIPPGGISFLVTKAVADALAVYAASGTYLTAMVHQA